MNKYKCFLLDYYATGEGSVIAILILDPNYPEKYITEQIVQVFGEYFSDFVKEVDQEELKNYENYLPRYVIGILSGQITPGAFRWHSQFMINFG